MSVSFGAVASGQTVTGQTVTGGELSTAKNNITFKDCIFTGQHIMRVGPNSNIIIDGGSKTNDNSVTTNTYEGQFQVIGTNLAGTSNRSGCVVKNFVTTGGSGDGFQLGDVAGMTFDNVEFKNHAQVSTIHADSCQVMNSNFIRFDGCWFHNNAAALMMVDWNNANNTIIDCLFTNSDGWDACMSGVPNVKFEHNTIYNPNYGTRILDDHSGNPSSTNYSLRYNALPAGFGFTLSSGSGTATPNLTSAVYVSPGNPGTKAGFMLKTPVMSPDGTVYGSRRLGVINSADATISVYENGTLRSSKVVTLS